MFKQFLLVAAIASLTLAGSSQAYCHGDLEFGVAAAESPFGSASIGCNSICGRPVE